jgi:hypothetical protein
LTVPVISITPYQKPEKLDAFPVKLVGMKNLTSNLSLRSNNLSLYTYLSTTKNPGVKYRGLWEKPFVSMGNIDTVVENPS